MTLSEFKSMAQRYGKTYDNSKKAAEEWSRTWGLSWWRSLWRYKEYTYNGYTYRSGKYHMRHYSASHVEYCHNGEEISRKEFMKAIAEMEYKEPDPVVYEPKAYTQKHVPHYVQMELAF